jgi:glycopeptide antibiotics resistance protein
MRSQLQPTTPQTAPFWSDERLCAAAASGFAAFIVYGSLLPFDLRRPDTFNLVTWLKHIALPWPLIPVADMFVNVSTGIPFGFFLTGALRRRRREHRIPAARVVALVACITMLMSTSLEMLQVLSRTRQSAWGDALAQVIGAGIGMLAWAVVGRRSIRWIRAVTDERSPFGLAARLLQFYVPLYLVIELSPLWETNWAARYAHKPGPLVPLTYHFEFTFSTLRNVGANVFLNVPIGALAVLGWVRRATYRPMGQAFLLGAAIVVSVEVAQGFAWSRYAGLQDIVAGVLGIAIGAAAAVEWVRVPPRSAAAPGGHPWLLMAAGAWTLVLIVNSWEPFDFQFTADFFHARFREIPWIPLKAYYPYYAATPLTGLHEVLRRCLAGVPLGLFLRSAWPTAGDRRVRFRQAVVCIAIATIVMIAIEIGQIFVPTRFPDLTDVMFGVIGASLGSALSAAVARRWAGISPTRSEARMINMVPAAAESFENAGAERSPRP